MNAAGPRRRPRRPRAEWAKHDSRGPSIGGRRGVVPEPNSTCGAKPVPGALPTASCSVTQSLHGPRGGPPGCRGEIEQRALPRSRRSYDGHRLAGVNGARDVAKHRELTAVRSPEELRDPVYFQLALLASHRAPRSDSRTSPQTDRHGTEIRLGSVPRSGCDPVGRAGPDPAGRDGGQRPGCSPRTCFKHQEARPCRHLEVRPESPAGPAHVILSVNLAQRDSEESR